MFIERSVRRAFTLVEMLVVIAVIGVLIGLLLPAVNAAREAGRRMQCVNNLKQLGLAMHNYENIYKIFPINWGATADGAGPLTKGQSWITGLLPHLEEKPLYNAIKLGEPMNYVTGSFNNLYASRQAVQWFICPSDYGSSNGTQVDFLEATSAAWIAVSPTLDPTLALTNYKACAGANWAMSVDPVPSVRCTTTPIFSKTGRNSNSTDGLDHGNGVICRGRHVPTATQPAIGGAITTAIRDIVDGTTRTFAIGEALPANCEASAWYSYEAGTATCGIPLNLKERDATTGAFVQPQNSRSDATDPNNRYFNRGFASRHPGGANFCMCDGSVSFIADDIEYLRVPGPTDPPAYITINAQGYVPGVYMNMATIDGGELFKAPGL